MKYILVLALTIFSLITLRAEDAVKPLAAYRSFDIWHIIDNEGDVIFSSADIESVGGFSEGMLRVKLKATAEEKEGKWAFLNMKGEVLFTSNYDIVRDFKQGRALVMKFTDIHKRKRKFGFIDTQGNEIITADKMYASEYNEGYSYIMDKDGNKSFIDTTGKDIIKFDTLLGYQFNEGLTPVSRKDASVGYMNTKGEIVIGFNFPEPGKFACGLAPNEKTSMAKSGYINHKGEYKITPAYDICETFSEGVAVVSNWIAMERKQDYGVIDSTGKVIIDLEHRKIRPCSDGMIAVSNGYGWGYFDKTGKQVIDFKYSFAEVFVDGLAWVTDRVNKKFGFIDKTGEIVIEIENPERAVDLRIQDRKSK